MCVNVCLGNIHASRSFWDGLIGASSSGYKMRSKTQRHNEHHRRRSARRPRPFLFLLYVSMYHRRLPPIRIFAGALHDHPSSRTIFLPVKLMVYITMGCTGATHTRGLRWRSKPVLTRYGAEHRNWGRKIRTFR